MHSYSEYLPNWAPACLLGLAILLILVRSEVLQGYK